MILASGRERGEEGVCCCKLQTFRAVIISRKNHFFIHHLKVIDHHAFGLCGKREKRRRFVAANLQTFKAGVKSREDSGQSKSGTSTNKKMKSNCCLCSFLVILAAMFKFFCKKQIKLFCFNPRFTVDIASFLANDCFCFFLAIKPFFNSI